MTIRITKPRLAAAGLFVLAGVGLGSLLSPLVGSALATAGQIVNISDHSGSAYFAKVDPVGRLSVNPGVITVRPASPSIPWSASENIEGGFPGVVIAGPSPLHIDVTSLSISTEAPTGSGIHVHLFSAHVPSTATSCNGATIDGGIWEVRDVGDGVTPVSFSFPTPLFYGQPANTRACLFAQALTGYTTTMNAVGFYGV
jgi:hypothetical protein